LFIQFLSSNNTNTRSQTPLKELLVFHPDEQYLSDVKSLERYIHSELNVRDVVFTADEALSGVRYRAVADWGVLGRKLRKDIGRVKNALPNVSSNDVKMYTETGKLSVDGIDLVTGDLTVQRYIELPTSAESQHATHTDNDVVVRLDIKVHPELMGEWFARELMNRIQKLRKKAGLQATDDVDIFYQFDEASEKAGLATLREYSGIIRKTCRNVPVDASERKAGKELVIEEEQEVNDVKFMLSLVRP
jgi:isoleucyl-tRNA synthetase